MHPRMHLAALLVALAATVIGTPRATAQSTQVDVELGYQWLDVSGAEGMFRTLVNDDDGFVLRNLALTSSGNEGLFDRLRVDASGFGGNPSGRFRLDTGLADTYRLRLNYNRLEAYSALPGFANPLLADGDLPGQHTFDRTRQLVDLEVTLLPGHRFSPIVGYRSNQIDGHRRTTRHVGQDEFRLTSRLDETEEELYAGLTFTAGQFEGTVIQGWRSFEGRERLALVAGAGDGNNPGPVLGRDVYADSYSRTVRTDADTPVTTALVNGRLGDRVRLKGTFAYADADAETSDSELLSGSLASFALSRFFASLDESVSNRSESPSWRGDLAASVDLTPRLTLDASYQVRDRELEGWSLVSSLYLDTLNFSGADPRDISSLVEARTHLERTDSTTSLRLTARNLGPATLWAGYSLADQELKLAADPSEIVVPGAQEGRFDRRLDSYVAGAKVVVGRFDASLEWQGEDADEAVVRTDFLNRDRYRLRASWRPCRFFQLSGIAEQVSADNPAGTILYDLETDRYAAQVLVTPVERLTFRLGYDSYSTDSDLVIRTPYDFELAPSLHTEEGEALDAGVVWTHGRFSLDAGYSSYENDGTFAYQLDHGYARLGFDLTESTGLAVELETYDYSEELLAPADFDSNRYGLFVRFRL